MPKNTIFVDIETYRNFFYIGIKRLEDGKRKGFEFSERRDFDRAKVRAILKRNLVIGFNSLTYDIPLIYLALTGVSNSELKDASDRIIKGGLKWWDVERELGVSLPKIDHIDLFEPNPSVRDGLKTLNGRLHGKRLQDLPYDEATILTHAQMDDVADYCLTSDLDATENLFHALREPIEFRKVLGEQYGIDFRSKSDAQMGEAIVKSRVEALTGKRPQRVETKPGTVFRYEVPAFFQFKTKQLQDLVETIRNTQFVIDKDGKVGFPKSLEGTKIKIGSSVYSFGIGGLHSTESCRAVHTDDDYVLVDADVAGQYPSIIKLLGLFPKALGKHFLTVYSAIMDARLTAKQRAKVLKDEIKRFKTEIEALGRESNFAAELKRELEGLERELVAMLVQDKGGKIALNGVYGKLGSIYSVLYAPHLMIAVTLTGQLSLLMLIESAELAGIPVVSGNTDGVVFKLPRAMYKGIKGDRLLGGPLKDIADEWERVTSFKLEFAEYRSLYNRDVNTYLAIKAPGLDGKCQAKRKGVIANHWHPDSPDYDQREQMKKNPQMTICGDAVLKFLLDGTPIEKTIRENADIRGFITVIKATGGATWRDGYLGKVVRFYWSTDGDTIIKVKAHPVTGNRPKVPKTDGCKPCMTLPDTMPADVDYDRYIAEAKQILTDIGWTPPATGPSPLELIFNRLVNA
ncbi:MAG: hypothetical protein DI537_20470 [Stutzerimonas stutzeri]|nr:MAG: hypothetical protein DI537_20470 [Stutzerimonas stutzeri]